MIFTPVKIEHLIKRHAYEVERLKAQRDHLQSIVDDDLDDDFGLAYFQIQNIDVRIDKLETRIKALKDFKKEL